MGFKADVFSVIIVSPSDISAERKAVREIIDEWNIRYANDLKKVLLPVGWETHTTPDMGGSPQSIINEQILFRCDLLVGIFWTRIGTPTLEYASGSVEEIERHIAAGKPAMLYFSEKPIRPGDLDKSQYDELVKFKNSCQPRGLYKGFKSLSDFRKQFENNLAIKMNDIYFKAISEIINTDKKQQESPLSSDEKKLLKTASLDKHGLIHKVLVRAGTYIETNSIHIITDQSAREIARWKSALQSLIDKNLIKGVGNKGDTFEVTATGYAAADVIEGL